MKWRSALRPLLVWFAGDSAEAMWNIRALDGAVLFDEVHATEPIPTGERHK